MVLAQKQTGRPMDQNRRSKHKPRTYSQLIFNKGAQNTGWRNDSLQQMLLGKLDIRM
jgi:hypothetical protein